MSWIPFYADEDDFRSIIDRLNADGEIAVILATGRGKWIAKPEVPGLPDGEFLLWHLPGGTLPLLSSEPGGADVAIPKPFEGWTERRQGANPSVPFFGSIPCIFELRKATRGVESPNAIGLSSVGWVGNRYKSLGLGARRETGNWWRRFQRWVQDHAEAKISRWDAPPRPEPEIWAFPSAHRRIEGGAGRDANSHL